MFDTMVAAASQGTVRRNEQVGPGGDRVALVAALVRAQRQLAWWAAAEAAALAGLHALDDVYLVDVPESLHDVLREQGRDWVSEEVAVVLRIPGRYARDRMVTAHQLVTRCPEMVERLRAGAVTPVQARALADAVTGLSDEVCARVNDRVMGRVAEQTNIGFARSLRRALLAEAPVSRDEALAAAVSQRQVRLTPVENGMAELWALLPAPEAMRLKTAIWRLGQYRKAFPSQEDPPYALPADLADLVSPVVVLDEAVVADQRRADALVELGDRYLAASDPTGRRNRRAPVVQVTMSLATLVGADNEPGELAGYGPIPAPMARAVAFDPTGTWRRLVTDPLGQLLDYGRTRYRPPRRLAEFVHARDQICVFPTCTRRAETCELDHTVAWKDGGPTNANNLAPLCGRHHHLKHEAGWTLRRTPTGTHQWTTPTGCRYTNARC